MEQRERANGSIVWEMRGFISSVCVSGVHLAKKQRLVFMDRADRTVEVKMQAAQAER